MARRRIGQKLHHRKRGRGFAGARLAYQRHRLAGTDVEGDTVDRAHLPAALPEGDGEVFHLQQLVGRGLHQRNVFGGPRGSRAASPMKIRSESMRATMKKPAMPSQGAWMLALPCLSSTPSEAEPGGRPKPRKSSAVRVITDRKSTRLN